MNTNGSDLKVGRIEQLTNDTIVGVNAGLLKLATAKLNENATEIRRLREENKRLTESVDAAKIVIDKLIRTYNNREKPLWAQHLYRVVELAKQWWEENK